jgi:hypothetical protein
VNSGPSGLRVSILAKHSVRPLWSQATVMFLGEYFIPRTSNIQLGIRATHKIAQNMLSMAFSACLSTVECAGFKYEGKTTRG